MHCLPKQGVCIMTLQATDRLTQILRDAPDNSYYFSLTESEPSINWLDFAALLYKKSQSTSTITTYCKGIGVFRSFLQTRAEPKTLAQIIADIKSPAANGLVYKVLDDFTTWCSVNKGYRPRSIKGYVASICKLFAFVDVEIDPQKFKSKVSGNMPKPQDLADEYPDNKTIQKILNTASTTMRGFVMTLCDTGFEPIDAAHLKVKDFRFSEEPVRIAKNREKTGHMLEGFVSKDTVEVIKQIISLKNKQPDDYIFIDHYGKYGDKILRIRYNRLVARSGFVKVVKVGKKTYYPVLDKIDGHNFGKYHLKVYKKRGFSIVITVVPDYIAQGMLGRRAYLHQYNRQPLEKRQEFARKILKAVSIHSEKVDKQETIKEMAKLMGIDETQISDEKLAAMQGLLGRIGQFIRLPADQLNQVNEILKTGENNGETKQ
jgi:integrase-like protein